MSGFDRTLALRLQMTAEFASASREAARELDAVAKSLKAIKNFGAIKVEGLDTLGSAIGRVAAGATDLEARTRAAQKATADMASGMSQATGNANALVVAYSRVADAARRASEAAAGLNTVSRQLGTISIGRVSEDFSKIALQADAANAKVRALTSSIHGLIALPPPQSRGTFFESLSRTAGSSSSPITVVGGGGYGNRPPISGALSGGGGGIPVPGGTYYPAGAGGAGGGGGGGGVGVPPGGGGGFNWSGAGKSMWSLGSNLSSMGMGAAINAAMLAPLVKSIVKDMADIDDLMSRTASAFQGTPERAKEFNDFLSKMVGRVGGDYKDTISSGYNLVSATALNYNSPQGMAALKEIAERNAILTIIGGSSTHHVSNAETALDTSAMFKHFFGQDAGNPKKAVKDYALIQNTLTNLRNTTSTETDLAGSSFRTIGPMANSMGIPFEEIAGLIGIMAENKIRGQQAGNAIKRILARQNAPAGQLQKVMDVFKANKMDISLYNDDGSQKDVFTLLENINKAEKHLKPERKNRVNQLLAGLYAIPQFAMLLKDVEDRGGAQKAREYGHSLAFGHGHGKTDALHTTYNIRSKDNLQIQSQKVMGDTLDSLHKTFKLIEPDLAHFLQDIDQMIKWFDKLPDPVKKFLVEGLLLTAFLNAGVGVMGLFVGNLLKMGGGFLQLVGWIQGLKTAGTLTTIFTSLGATFRALGLVFLANPIGLTITGLVIAIAALSYAWSHDLGGIQEKTHGAIAWVKDEFQKGVKIAENFIKGTKDWFGKFGPTLRLALDAAFPLIGMLDPKFREAAMKMLAALINGAETKAVDIMNFFKDLGVNILKTVMNWAGGMINAGKSALENLGKGITGGIDALKSHVKNALQNVRNLFPGSEPKDSSSPLYGLGRSGAAAMDNFAQGIRSNAGAPLLAVNEAVSPIDSALQKLFEGHKSGHKKAKGHKAKGPIPDAIIDIKNQSIAEIEKMTKELEAQMHAAGAHLRNIGVTFVSHGQVVGRMMADPRAAHMATGVNAHDQTARNLQDFLKMNPAIGIDAKLAAIQKALLTATDAHVKATIYGILTTVQKQYDAMTSRLQAQFYGKNGSQGNITGGQVGALDKEFQKADEKQQQFNTTQQRYNDLIAQRVALRKNQELPTLQELTREHNLEQNEINALNRLHQTELNLRAQVNTKVQELEHSISKLNDSDKNQALLKTQLTQQLDQYKLKLEQLNTDLETQDTTITGLNQKIRDNTQAMHDAVNASSAWERALVSATEKAGKAALTHLADTFSAGIDKMLENAFGKWKGSGISGSLKSAIGDFFATFISELLHSAVANLMKYAESTLTSFFKNMVAKFFGGGGSGGFSGGSSGAMTDVLGGGFTMGGGVFVPGIGDVGTAGKAGGGGFGLFSKSNPNSFLGKLLGNSGSAIGHGGGLSTLAQSEMYAAIFGQMMGGGSHNTWAQIGGAIGSFIPIPGAGAALAFIGSLFGHADNPNSMPDKYDTARFTQFVGELQGSAGTGYGPNYNGSSDEIQKSLGGKPMLQYIQDWIKAHLTAGTAEEQKLAKQLEAQYGTSGGGKLAFDANIGQEHVIGGSLAGSYVDIHNAAGDAITSIQKLGQASAASADQMGTDANRLAASFQTMMWGGPNGFAMPDLLGGSTGTPSGSKALPWTIRKIAGLMSPGNIAGIDGPLLTPYLGKHLDPATNAGSTTSEVHVHLLENAQVSNASLIDEIIAILPQLKTPIANAVAQKQYQNARLRGDNVSAI